MIIILFENNYKKKEKKQNKQVPFSINYTSILCESIENNKYDIKIPSGTKIVRIFVIAKKSTNREIDIIDELTKISGCENSSLWEKRVGDILYGDYYYHAHWFEYNNNGKQYKIKIII